MSASDYVELHASSAFNFLRGANVPEHVLAAAHKAGLSQIAILDRDGVYGAPRAYQAARENNLTARVGAEITLADGSALPVLVKNRTGYKNLCRLITFSKEKARPPDLRPDADNLTPGVDPHLRKRPCFATWEEIAPCTEGLIALTGDEDGPIARALATGDRVSAEVTTTRLKNLFGPDNVCVELQRRRLRGEDVRIQQLVDLASAQKLPLLATSGARYATPADRIVADSFTCLRHHTTLDQAGRLLSENDGRHIRTAADMRNLFGDYPEAITNTRRVADQLDFTLQNLGYEFPSFDTKNGRSMERHLRDVTFTAARKRMRGALPAKIQHTLESELTLINELGFAGYFLIIWDICKWAREERGILVQGRGSAANSSVCYYLGITAVNPLEHSLLFERFLSKGRVGTDGKPSWPDVDLDFPSGERREDVIQEVYRRYNSNGEHGAAMVANVITYRGRSTVREMGKILGLPEDVFNRFSSLYANGDFPNTLDLEEQLRLSGISKIHPRLPVLVKLTNALRNDGHGLPRHLGQHSGGMVLCPGHLHEVVPLEPASMEGRTIVQWDKDDCENLGLVKIDFLGLGMMAVLQDCFELCAKNPEGPKAFHDIPCKDDLTYENIRAARTVGVFQIESRAQMSTLPRFKPKNLYDLAQQVAIVRPGPIVGNLVHPLIKRRDKIEPIDYIDPSLEEKLKPILERTCGVILFQEQMIAIAMELAEFTGGEAEELRRAMGFTKNQDRLDRIKAKLCSHLEKRKHPPHVIHKVVEAVSAFAFYGFPESHAISFALLAYASTWLKTHRIAEFTASLLNNQPMGFYSPATILQDARRDPFNLKVHAVCVRHSDWKCTVEAERVLRLGLLFIKGLRERAVLHMMTARAEKPFASLADFLARTIFTPSERRALASVGALNVFAGHRRAALWQAEAAWSSEETLFNHATLLDDSTQTDTPPGSSPNYQLPTTNYSPASPSRSSSPRETHLDFPLRPMSLPERLGADFAGMSLTAGVHPMATVRAQLPDVTPANELIAALDGHTITIAGSVICRQRPGTAKGVVFISLEDETGIANSIVYSELFEKQRLLITQETALRITGKLQHKAGVAHVRAEKIEPLRLEELPAQASHDFH